MQKRLIRNVKKFKEFSEEGNLAKLRAREREWKVVFGAKLLQREEKHDESLSRKEKFFAADSSQRETR